MGHTFHNIPLAAAVTGNIIEILSHGRCVGASKLVEKHEPIELISKWSEYFTFNEARNNCAEPGGCVQGSEL